MQNPFDIEVTLLLQKISGLVSVIGYVVKVGHKFPSFECSSKVVTFSQATILALIVILASTERELISGTTLNTYIYHERDALANQWMDIGN